MSRPLSEKLFIMIAVLLAVLTAPFLLFVYFGARELPGSIISQVALAPEALEAIKGFSDNILIGSALIVLVCLVLAFFASSAISRQILHPLREVIRGLRLIMAGEAGVNIALTGSRELDELEKVFNIASKHVAGLNEQMGLTTRYLEAMIDPVWVVDPFGKITGINPAFTQTFGYGADEAVGSDMLDFLDERTRQTVRQRYLSSAAEEFTNLEGSFISKNEGLVPVLISSSNLAQDGLVINRIGIIKDFRTEEELMQALRSEKEHTDLLMDSIEDMMVVVDRDYQITRANRATRVLYGEDPVGQYCYRIFTDKLDRCYMLGEDCPARNTFESGRPHSVTRVRNLPGGKEGHFDIRAFPVEDRQGEVSSVLLSLRDVSGRIDFEQEIGQKNRELEALNTISKVLSRSLRSEETYKEVMERVIGLFSMDGGGLYLIDESGRKLTCVLNLGLSAPFEQSIHTLPIGKDLPGKAAELGNPLFFPDASNDPRTSASAFRHSGIKGLACCPIRGSEKNLGVFFLFSFQEREFTESDERILLSISEMMGISFENIKLYEKMRALYRQDRDRRMQERRDLLELSSLLASSLDMQKVLGSCISLIKKSCWADFAWLLTYDTEGTLRLRASTDSDYKEGEAIYTEKVDSLEGKASSERKPLMRQGIGTARNKNAHKRIKEFSTACSVPVYLGDRALGAFSLYYVADVSLTEEELHFLHTVGSVISVALERARLYESAILQRGMANTILESIADGVVTVDSKGCVTSLNRAAEELLGHKETDATGTSILSLMGQDIENDELREKLSDSLGRALVGETLSVEAPFTAPGRGHFPLMIQCAPVYGKEAGAAGVAIVLRDLSRERELGMVMGEFVKTVSEEFRSPLTVIAGMAEMVLEGDVEGKRSRQYLENMLAECRRLSDIVMDVLDLEKIETGSMAYSPEDVNMQEVFLHAEEITAPLAKSKGARIVTSVSKTAASIRADRTLLLQLARNLLENALVYSDQGVSITMRATQKGNSVTITVEDDGWGIADEDLAHVKEKFFRGSHATKTKGTGMGLPLCLEIARMHSGTLDVVSTQGAGTKIMVTIPKGR